MKKDIKLLRKFKEAAVKTLAERLQITADEAQSLVQQLEDKDIIRFEAPEYRDKPATVYTVDRQLGRDNIGMTSHKPGNIIVNTYLDLKSFVSLAVASVETVTGFASLNPFLIGVGIISWLISVSSLTDIKIGENGTAIIMALQQHSCHKEYATTEQQCRKEANEILVSHGYPEMDEEVFGKETAILSRIRCIEFPGESRIKLLEKVTLPF